jgi:hypothetical protein
MYTLDTYVTVARDHQRAILVYNVFHGVAVATAL